MTPKVSVVVVNYGSPKLVRSFLDSLSTHRDRDLVREVVIVDNGFPEKGDCRDSVSPSHHDLPIRFVRNREHSYASGGNCGVAATTGELVIIANNDIEWSESECLEPLLEALAGDERIFTVGPQLVYPDGRWQCSHRSFPSVLRAILGLVFWENLSNAFASWRFSHNEANMRARRVPYVNGAFLLVRRRDWDALDGFDESYHFYGDEVDLCWRARKAGRTCVTVPAARLIHQRGATSTAVAPFEFSQRQFAAGCAFVARNRGRLRAKVFDVIQRVAACERAVAYQLAALLIRSPSWKRRAKASVATARAALRPTSWESGW